ncbi:MAG: amidohydrolase family protein [Planctomycetales bacterium]|nr:amidohydrolase family protein [Planctomycetales bacterium]
MPRRPRALGCLALRGLALRTPDRLLRDATVVIHGGRFQAVLGAREKLPRGSRALDLVGMAAVPGLLNAHDHLRGTWAPRFGKGPYPNVYRWLEEYNPSTVRAERYRVPDAVIAALGGYRNLLSGAVLVADHDKRLPPETYASVPVERIPEYGREWVVRSATDPANWPPWGEGIAAEAERVPFLIHIAEGMDDEARADLAALDRLGGLRRHTLLVHAVGLSPRDMDRVAEVGAAVAWCPGSNLFLYGVTADVRALRARGVRLALGTDSPMSGSPSLLVEMRTAREAWRGRYGEDLPAADLLRLATDGAADALGLGPDRGRVAAGARADLVVFPSRGGDPAEELLALEPEDLDLVLRDGAPAAGRPEHRALFEAAGRPFAEVLHAGRPRLVAGDPLALLAEVERSLGYPKPLPYLPLAPLVDSPHPGT